MARGQDTSERSGSRPVFDFQVHAREILSAVPGSAVLVFDVDLRVQSAAGEAFRPGGFDLGSLPGQKLSAVLPAPAWAQLKGPYEAALAGRTSTFGYLSQEHVSYGVHVSPLVAAAEIVGALAVIYELTAEVDLESYALTGEALARQARHREALSLAAIGTWEVDLRTGETHWSQEYYGLYGVDPGVFVPSRAAFEEIVDPRDRGLERGA